MAGGICLICTFDPDGKCECEHIRQILTTRYIISCCVTFPALYKSTEKTLLYITTGTVYDYGIFILTFYDVNLYSQCNIP